MRSVSAELDPTEAHGLGGLYHSSPDRAEAELPRGDEPRSAGRRSTPSSAFPKMTGRRSVRPAVEHPVRRYVRDILGSARRLLHIIEDVLEIVAPRPANWCWAEREVDVGELIDESLRPFRDWCRSRQIKRRNRLCPTTSSFMSIRTKSAGSSQPDFQRRSKFGGQPKTRIALAARLDKSGAASLVSVRDRGIGMDPSAIERAFVPFAQLDNSLSRQFDGSGLGLSLRPRAGRAPRSAGSRSTARRASARRRRSFCLHTRPRPGSSAASAPA